MSERALQSLAILLAGLFSVERLTPTTPGPPHPDPGRASDPVPRPGSSAGVCPSESN